MGLATTPGDATASSTSFCRWRAAPPRNLPADAEDSLPSQGTTFEYWQPPCLVLEAALLACTLSQSPGHVSPVCAVRQSLWHLAPFRQRLLRASSLEHKHQGDPCVVCACGDLLRPGPGRGLRRQRGARDSSWGCLRNSSGGHQEQLRGGTRNSSGGAQERLLPLAHTSAPGSQRNVPWLPVLPRGTQPCHARGLPATSVTGRPGWHSPASETLDRFFPGGALCTPPQASPPPPPGALSCALRCCSVGLGAGVGVRRPR